MEPETTVHAYPGRNFKSSALGVGSGRAWQGFCPRVSSWNLDKTNGPSQARHFVQINCILPKRRKQSDPSLPHMEPFSPFKPCVGESKRVRKPLRVEQVLKGVGGSFLLATLGI